MLGTVTMLPIKLNIDLVQIVQRINILNRLGKRYFYHQVSLATLYHCRQMTQTSFTPKIMN